MNFKKSFAMCLSILISFTPLSLRAMYNPDDSNSILNVAFCEYDNDDDNIVYEKCSKCMTDVVPDLKDAVVLECGHVLHGNHIKQYRELKERFDAGENNLDGWGISAKCLICEIKTRVERAYRDKKYWKNRFKDLGIKDIFEIPEFSGKSEEEVTSYFLNLIKKRAYKNLRCHWPYRAWPEQKEGMVVYDGYYSSNTPFTMRDANGNYVQVGIVDEKFRLKLDKAMLECSQIDWLRVSCAKSYLDLGRLDEVQELLSEVEKDGDARTLAEIHRVIDANKHKNECSDNSKGIRRKTEEDGLCILF